jgi:tRNA pseudouridine38-40 synthase
MKIAASVSYDGALYCGWQRQSHSPSVQQCVEEALSHIANHPISILCAGRTDTGVHATNQIIHFETESERPDRAWIFGTNTKLPDSIVINWITKVSDDFHARFSATARRYRYIIYNGKVPTAILPQGVTWERYPLDVEKMQDAAKHFLGEQDFSSVRAASCQSRTAHRFIHHLTVERKGQFLIIDIQANAFLHHMVRNITGLLIEVGRLRQEPCWVKAVLEAKDRTQAANTAAPNGLYLVDVDYPEHYSLPNRTLGPLFWT